MFHKDIAKRPTAKDLLNHPFITDNEPSIGDFTSTIQTDDQEYLKTLLSKFDINNTNLDGSPHPLDVAVSCNRLICLISLVENGKANINKGTKLLVTAVSQGYYDISAYLLNHTKIDVNEVDEFGNAALHLACQRKYKELIRFLCSFLDIDVNKQNQNGFTPLHLVAYRCDFDHFDILVKHNDTDIRLLDNNSFNSVRSLLSQFVLCSHRRSTLKRRKN